MGFTIPAPALGATYGLEINTSTGVFEGVDLATQAEVNAATAVNRSLPTGALYHNFNRYQAITNAASALVSGKVTMCGLWLPAGAVVTKFTACSGATAESGGTHLWGVLCDASRNRLALTADSTGAAAWAATTAFDFTLTAPYTVTTEGWYYCGICCVGTVPSVVCQTTGNTTAWTVTPSLGGTSADTGLTDPASCPATLGAITAAPIPYVYIS